MAKMSTFQERIKAAVSRIGSQAATARVVSTLSGRKVSPQTIQFLCSDKKDKPSESSSLSPFIADAAGVNLLWLVTGEGPMERVPSTTETETLGQRLARLRNKKNLSQAELATACGWPDISSLDKFERDEQEPSLKEIRSLALALGTSAQEIAFGTTHDPLQAILVRGPEALTRMFSPRVIPLAYKLRQLDLHNTLPEGLLSALDSLLVQFAELTGTPLPPSPVDPQATPSPLDSTATSRLQAELSKKSTPQS